jgi:hypothetical protein
LEDWVCKWPGLNLRYLSDICPEDLRKCTKSSVKTDSKLETLTPGIAIRSVSDPAAFIIIMALELLNI